MAFTPRNVRDLCTVDVVVRPSDIRISVAGDVDMNCEDDLSDALDQVNTAPPADIVADVSQVGFLGSVGLNFFVRLHVRAASTGTMFTMLNPRPVVLRALQVSGLDGVLTVSFDRAGEG